MIPIRFARGRQFLALPMGLLCYSEICHSRRPSGMDAKDSACYRKANKKS